MDGAVDIRLMRPDEVEAAEAVLTIAFRRYLLLIMKTPEVEENPYDYLPEAVADERSWVAVLGGKIAGAAQVDRAGETAWKIDLVGVLPEFSGRGYGAELMARIEVDARKRGVATLSLHTAEKATGLVRMYESLGFQTVHKGPPPHGLDSNIRCYMEKTLS
ncbi:MAG: GNAT family N-acetyltransferase [Boseongicola sp.]|nr:MAG: GNAT family N-acetyltransferase [Boseongicola sp.]